MKYTLPLALDLDHLVGQSREDVEALVEILLGQARTVMLADIDKFLAAAEGATGTVGAPSHPTDAGRTAAVPAAAESTLPEVEVLDDDTPEGREARYLDRHLANGRRGVSPGVGKPRAVTLRPWDDPDDLQYHDAGRVQPEREGGELSEGDGSVSVTMG